MVRSRRHFRILALLWGALQFALPAAFALADGASAAHSAAEAVAHVEEHSGKRCQPPHSADCGICRYFSTYAANIPALHGPTWPLALVTRSSEHRTDPRSNSVAGLPASRAPPLV